MIVYDQWNTVYDTYPDIEMINDGLSHNILLNQPTITKLVVKNRKDITQNLLCLLDFRFVYLKLLTISTNYICRNVVLLSFRWIIFNSIHASLFVDHIGKYKILYRFKLRRS